MHFMSLYPRHLYSNFHPSVCSIKPPNPGPVAGLCVRLRFHIGWPSFLCIWTNHFLLWRAWYLGNNIPCLGLSWCIEGRALESCFCVFGWLVWFVFLDWNLMTSTYYGILTRQSWVFRNLKRKEKKNHQKDPRTPMRRGGGGGVGVRKPIRVIRVSRVRGQPGSWDQCLDLEEQQLWIVFEAADQAENMR